MCALIPDKPQKFKSPNSVKYSIDIPTQNLYLNLSSIHKHNTVGWIDFLTFYPTDLAISGKMLLGL